MHHFAGSHSNCGLVSQEVDAFISLDFVSSWKLFQQQWIKKGGKMGRREEEKEKEREEGKIFSIRTRKLSVHTVHALYIKPERIISIIMPLSA